MWGAELKKRLFPPQQELSYLWEKVCDMDV